MGHIWITSLVYALCAGMSSAIWSPWGPYGNCSRLCGGGLSNMTRTCLGATHTCRGHGIRYKTCNSQPCTTGPADQRDGQCRSYNNVSLQGNYYHWAPEYSPAEPCALYCRAIETGSVLKMHPVVVNGTACTIRGKGVCISGKCRRVGCDNVVGSSRRLDACGVCGGGGESCTRRQGALTQDGPDVTPLGKYQWEIRWSPCSSSCGTGVQFSAVKCMDSNRNRTVKDSFCRQQATPHAAPSRPCADQPTCKYRWHTFKWSSCSRTCGTGSLYRSAICLQLEDSGNWRHVTDDMCTDSKPDTRTGCNKGDCPEWLTAPWSQCSVTCNYGQQKRKVICKSTFKDGCDEKAKPPSLQKCFAGKSCDEDSSFTQFDFFDDEQLQRLFSLPQFRASPWGDCSVTCGSGYRIRNVTCVRGDRVFPLSQCQGLEPNGKRECHEKRCPVNATADDTGYRWRHGKYGQCSATCGRGTSRTTVECVDGNTDTLVLDSWCLKFHRPEPLVQPCNAVPCPPSWQVGEYDTCSVPCGGGRQSRDVACVQVSPRGDVEPVEAFRCPDPIPLSQRSCNLQFCQAQWMTGDWGECSVTCGGGVETRSIYCVKSVKNHVTVNVSNTECIGPKPPANRQCHLGECYKLLDLPEIKQQKGKYIQIKRMKRVNLKVGEEAMLLPNQAVKIRCPVKNFHRKLIFWTKNQRLVPLVGRVRVSSNGALRITRANPKIDQGVFTCTAGLLQAEVVIKFQSKKDAKLEANTILNTIFQENFNVSFIDRPQADEMLKKKGSKYFADNSRETNSLYDYSSFTTTKWSECSKQCGLGTQSRQVTCNRVTDKFIRLLPEGHCLQQGISRPPAERKCVIQDVCPQWITADWSQCSVKFCRKDGYAVQSRPVRCTFLNRTRAKDIQCDRDTRPAHKRPCENTECQSVWQTSKWSQCGPACSRFGKKVRTLTCVWTSTKKPAMDSCRYKPRPLVSKRCKPRTCKNHVCRDESRYCSLAGQLKMCRYHKFRSQCCSTCRRANI